MEGCFPEAPSVWAVVVEASKIPLLLNDAKPKGVESYSTLGTIASPCEKTPRKDPQLCEYNMRIKLFTSPGRVDCAQFYVSPLDPTPTSETYLKPRTSLEDLSKILPRPEKHISIMQAPLENIWTPA